MTKQVEGQMSLFGPDTWYGKMSQEPYHQTTGKTSESSSKKRQESPKKMPMFLDLTENGQIADASWEMGGALLGRFTMHSFGELPREDADCRLSEILVDTPHPKYSLSAKACKGILTRADRRGKGLPEILRKALENQIESSDT